MPIPPTGLSLVWIDAEASMPIGWRVSGLVREPDESWRAQVYRRSFKRQMPAKARGRR